MVRPDDEPGPLDVRTQHKEGPNDREALFLRSSVVLLGPRAGTVSRKTPCHPSPQEQLGTPSQLREPIRTPSLYSLPVTRSPRKTPEGAKREEGDEKAVLFLWGSRATGAPLSP